MNCFFFVVSKLSCSFENYLFSEQPKFTLRQRERGEKERNAGDCPKIKPRKLKALSINSNPKLKWIDESFIETKKFRGGGGGEMARELNCPGRYTWKIKAMVSGWFVCERGRKREKVQHCYLNVCSKSTFLGFERFDLMIFILFLSFPFSLSLSLFQ